MTETQTEQKKKPEVPATVEPEGAIDTAPCFCCASARGVPTGHWWVLPILSSHVRCVDCGRTYNAKSGDSNGPTFFLYFVCIVLGLAAGAILYHVTRGG